MFKRRKPSRLYYPTKSSWYTRPRRRPGASLVRRRPLFDVKKSFRQLMEKSFYVVLGAVVLCFVVLIMIFSTYFSISTIQVQREDFNINTATISNELNRYIGRNILFFPRREAVATIQESFPEFASVKVGKTLPNTLTVMLESHPIVANVRAYHTLPEPELTPEEKAIMEMRENLKDAFSIEEEEPPEPPAPIEQRALLNQVGQAIFDQAENLELMTVIIQELSQPLQDREVVMPRDHMDLMLEAIQYFNSQFTMQVKSTQYYPVGREIHLRTDSDLVIWISLERDIKEQIDRLKSIYEAAELNKEEINYIDLRINEKVIYCPRRTPCDR